MRVKIAEWGNSLGLRVPKAVADQLGLKAGSEVEVTLEGAEARLTLVEPPRTALRSMVEEMQRLMAMGVLPPEAAEPDLLDWGPDVGAEIIDDGGYPQPERS